MITDKLKAQAIALLKNGESIEKVSGDLVIPYKLVEEWYDGLDIKDLTKLQAHTYAMTKVLNGEVIPKEDVNKDLLKVQIEETAIEIVKEAKANIHTGDLVQSKSLQALATTCSTLYKSIIGESIKPQVIGDGEQGATIFEQLSID